MKRFTIIWAGQLVSIVGTSITRFALIVYVFTYTNSILSTVMIAFYSMFPFIIASFFAGIVIDKFSRKHIMIFADIIAALCTFVMFIMFQFNIMTLTIIYVCQFVTGFVEAFQSPAFTSTISVMVPKEHYKRANAMRNFSQSGSKIIAPIMAGFLFGFIGIQGILVIDLITFIVGVGSILFISIQTIETDETLSRLSIQSFKESYLKSFRTIKAIEGLPYLMFSFIIINLLSGITYFGILPMYILGQTNNSSVTLGLVEFFLGLGGVIGSFLVFTLPNPRYKTKIIFLFMLLSFITGDILFAIGRGIEVWAIAGLLTSICVAFIVTNETTIWQEKIPKNMQGRIFSLKYSINLCTLPIGYILGGVFAEFVFQPFMNNDSTIQSFLLNIVGLHPANGMAVMFIITGFLGVLISVYGLTSNKIRALNK